MNHILSARHGLRIAVIVNDMSEINIDAALVKHEEFAFSRTDEKLVEMSNGCICCTLREDLLVEVGRLAREGRFDYLVIESTGISEPLPVAETFTFEDEQGEKLSSIAKLDTMVTVVDGHAFLIDYVESPRLADLDQVAGDEDERTLSDLLIEQVEYADVIVINKIDLMDSEEVIELRQLLHRLNPPAKILTSTHAVVPLSEILKQVSSILRRLPTLLVGSRHYEVSSHPNRTPMALLVLCTGPVVPSIPRVLLISLRMPLVVD